jgi:hypothetical protein
MLDFKRGHAGNKGDIWLPKDDVVSHAFAAGKDHGCVLGRPAFIVFTLYIRL